MVMACVVGGTVMEGDGSLAVGVRGLADDGDQGGLNTVVLCEYELGY